MTIEKIFAGKEVLFRSPGITNDLYFMAKIVMVLRPGASFYCPVSGKKFKYAPQEGGSGVVLSLDGNIVKDDDGSCVVFGTERLRHFKPPHFRVGQRVKRLKDGNQYIIHQVIINPSYFDPVSKEDFCLRNRDATDDPCYILYKEGEGILKNDKGDESSLFMQSALVRHEELGANFSTLIKSIPKNWRDKMDYSKIMQASDDSYVSQDG